MLGIICAAYGMACSAPAVAAFYRCVVPGGATNTSNTAILDCKGELSVQQQPGAPWVPVESMSPQEKAARNEEKRKADIAAKAVLDAAKADGALVAKYPNEAAHRKAREDERSGILKGLVVPDRRIRELAEARKPLTSEAEFYSKPGTIPIALQRKLEENDALVAAQTVAIKQTREQEAEMDKRRDAELARLKSLWASRSR